MEVKMEETALVHYPVINDAKKPEPEFRVYKKRWLILLLFWIYTITSFIHLIEYSVIADAIVKFYSVSYSMVDTTAMVFFLIYIPCCLPGNYILDKLGLRVSILIGSIIVSVGSWIKVASVDPNRFWVLLLGQSLISICQVLVLPLPSKLAAVWFGPKEVSFACSIGIVASQVASALGFLIPPLIVDSESLESIHRGLQNLSYIYAVPATVVIPLVYFLFDDNPPSPPSKAQFKIEENEKLQFNYKESLKNLMTNKPFVLLIIIYGVNVGMSTAATILLNQTVLLYHPNAAIDVGIIGLLMMVSGIAGSLISGYLAGKIGKLKEIIWISVAFTFVSETIFLFVMSQKLLVVYIMAITFSFFVNCIFCVGLDLAAELSYPEPVGASIGLLTISFQIFGIIFTYLYSYLFQTFSILIANLVVLVVILLGDCLLFFIKFNFKRSASNANSKC